jgi:hypothetical protein
VQGTKNNFAAYPSGDSHPSSAGHRKAAAEFLPLLHIYYNRWKTNTSIDNRDLQPITRTMHQAFPNPFNQAVRIYFQSTERPASSHIYDLLGRAIRRLDISSRQSDGVVLMTWDGRDDRGQALPTGLYFYRIITQTQSCYGKVFLNR